MFKVLDPQVSKRVQHLLCIRAEGSSVCGRHTKGFSREASWGGNAQSRHQHGVVITIIAVTINTSVITNTTSIITIRLFLMRFDVEL